MAKALDRDRIQVNYLLSESKNSIDSGGTGNPIKNLDVRLSKRETFQRNALDGIQVRDTDLNFEKMCTIFERQYESTEGRAEQLK